MALRTTKYLAKETDFIPWESALWNLEYYMLMFDRTEVFEALQAGTTSRGGSVGRCWAWPLTLSVLPAGLPEEPNPAPFPALQDNHSQLDQNPSRTH